MHRFQWKNIIPAVLLALLFATIFTGAILRLGAVIGFVGIAVIMCALIIDHMRLNYENNLLDGIAKTIYTGYINVAHIAADRLNPADVNEFLSCVRELLRRINKGAWIEETEAETARHIEELAKEEKSFDFRNYLLRTDHLLHALKSLESSQDLADDSPIKFMLKNMEDKKLLTSYWDFSLAPNTMDDICLRLTNLHYIRADMDGEESYLNNGLFAIEAMINITQEALDKKLSWSAWDESFVDACLMPKDGAKQTAEEYFSNELLEGYDYGTRMKLAYMLESIALPFRINAKFRLDLVHHELYMEYTVPHVQAFACIYSEERTTQKARLYALRLAAYIAKRSFEIDPTLETIFIKNDAFSDNDLENVLFFSFTKEAILNLASCIDDVNITYTDLLERMRSSLQFRESDSWFEEIDVPMHFDDMRYFRLENVQPASVTSLELSEKTKELTYAKSARDLEFKEDAQKSEILHDLRDFIHEHTSTQELVAYLSDVARRFDDPRIKDSIELCMHDLVTGEIEANDTHEVMSRFYLSNEMTKAVSDIAQAEPGSISPERVLDILDKANAQTSGTNDVRDTDERVYRYFSSPLDRIAYNKLKTDNREVVLLPSSYFNSLQIRCGIYIEQGQFDKAEPIVDEMLRIAPVHFDAILRAVSFYENNSDIFKAIELLKTGIKNTLSPRSCAWYYYRLAFMFHQIGNDDMALVCYEKCLTYQVSDIYDDAVQEMRMLKEKYNLDDIDSSKLDELLQNAGVPTGLDRADRARLISAIAALVNDGLYSTAGHMLFEASSQDVDRDVLVSITAPRTFNPFMETFFDGLDNDEFDMDDFDEDF